MMVTAVGFQHPWEKFAFGNSRLCPFNSQIGYRSHVSSESLERTRYRNNCSGTKILQQALTPDPYHGLWCLVIQRCHHNLESVTWSSFEHRRSHSLGRSRRVNGPLPLSSALLLAQLCSSMWESWRRNIYFNIQMFSFTLTYVCVCGHHTYVTWMCLFISEFPEWLWLSNNSIFLSSQINDNIRHEL